MSQINEINPYHHGETDTRMLLHPAVHATKHGHTKIILRAVDTDILVLGIRSPDLESTSVSALIGFWCLETSLCHTCSFYCKNWSCKSKYTFSFYNVLTGCDTPSELAGRGNKTSLDTWSIRTVQITHNLNGTRVCVACVPRVQKQKTRVASNHACAHICTRVKWMHHIHVLIHTKYLPLNDPPYNQ